MNNIFERHHVESIIARIRQLSPESQPCWGKMNAAQMFAHCSAFQQIATGEAVHARSWLGLVVGQFAKPVFYNDKPLPQNMSTIPGIQIADERNFEDEQERLIQSLTAFQHNGAEKCTRNPHPFFGKLSPEEWGKGIYKHLDHHLRQFGV